MYLDIASKEEGTITYIIDVVMTTVVQGFLPDRALTPPSLQGARSGGQSQGNGSYVV
jgi:hypothetical protein